MSVKYWSCPCGTRNERRKQRCVNEDCRRKRPKSRTKVTAHPQDTYEHYLTVARDVHGVTDESCCICGRPKPLDRRHDREHDHRTGLPRGIACFRCNKELLRHADLEQARQVTAYLERVDVAEKRGYYS